MRTLLAVAIMFVSSHVLASEFSQKSCQNYSKNAAYTKALEVISTNMKSTRADLCGLERLLDIHITDREFYNIEKQEVEPHVWVTLHYNEYSCQYFVRNADWVVTRKNCYNTTY